MPTDTIPLPVTAVTCLEDRAQVERATVVELAAGVQRLRFGPLTALAVDRSLHAEVTGAHQATVLDARIVRTWTPRTPRPTADDPVLRRQERELEDEQQQLQKLRERLCSRLCLLDELAADLLREIADTAGAGDPDQGRWSSGLDRTDAERETYGEQLHDVDVRLAALAADLTAIRLASDRFGDAPPELLAHLEIAVEAGSAGSVGLLVSHLVPCALWRPAYRATLAADEVTVETDAMVWQRTGEDWSDVRLTLSTARSSSAAEAPRLQEDRLTLEDRSPAERRVVDVSVREESIAELGPASVIGLPGVDDGGETRVLRPSSTVSVRADGRAHRVPVSAFTARARTAFTCAAELSPLVDRTVRFDNLAGHALLAGPVDLIRDSGFTGRGALEFAAPGAPVELAFGSCDDHRVTRSAESTRDTTTLTGRTVITRTVHVNLSRFSAPGEQGGRTVAVKERIPVSEISAVEVRVREGACSPVPDTVDPGGIVRWQVTLPPGGRRSLTLVYEVSASSKVSGL